MLSKESPIPNSHSMSIRSHSFSRSLRRPIEGWQNFNGSRSSSSAGASNKCSVICPPDHVSSEGQTSFSPQDSHQDAAVSPLEAAHSIDGGIQAAGVAITILRISDMAHSFHVKRRLLASLFFAFLDGLITLSCKPSSLVLLLFLDYTFLI